MKEMSLPSGKITFSPLQMDDWKTTPVSFWGPAGPGGCELLVYQSVNHRPMAEVDDGYLGIEILGHVFAWGVLVYRKILMKTHLRVDNYYTS